MTSREILIELYRIQAATAKLIDYHAGGISPRKPADPQDKRFDEWYQLYPRKVAKANARRAWSSRKLDKRADELIEQIKRYANSVKDKELKYIPHPASYINAERYEDELPGIPQPLSEQQKLKLMSR